MDTDADGFGPGPETPSAGPETTLPPWDTFEEPEREPGRGRRLLALAAIPWVVVAVIAVRSLGPGGRAVEADAVAAVPTLAPSAEAVASPVAAPSQGVDPTGDPQPEVITALRFGTRTGPGAGDAAAVATVVARSWLGSIGPEPDVDVGAVDGPPVYVEHLAVEAVDVPTPDVAVVTLVAVVLDHADEGYTGARAVRLAVPIAFGEDGAHPAGEPWLLTGPDLAARAPTWTPVNDPDVLVQAGEALAAGGYREIDVQEVSSSPTWPLRVIASAIAPGSDTASEHTVWLREHLGRFVIAGAVPSKESTP